MKKLAINHLRSPKRLKNFSVSMLLMKVSKYWKIVEFRKISIKMKNCKPFYESQTTSCLKEVIEPPPPPHTPPIPTDKILLLLSNKNFLREIYINIQTFAIKVLLESSSWASGNGAVQMFFLTPNRNMFSGKICKLRKAFGCVLGAFYFQFQQSWDS